MSRKRGLFDYPADHYDKGEFIVMILNFIGFAKLSLIEQKECIQAIENAITNELDDNESIFYWNEMKRKKKNNLIIIPAREKYIFVFHSDISVDKILDTIKQLYCHIDKHVKHDFRIVIAKGECVIYLDTNKINNVFGKGLNLAEEVINWTNEKQILVHENLGVKEEKGDLYKIFDKQAYNFYGKFQKKEFGHV